MNAPVPAGGVCVCAQLPVPLPLAGEAGAVVPVTASGSSGWEGAGGSLQPRGLDPAPRPRRWHERGWLCLAPVAVLAAPGQAPVLMPLLSPQVVPESGAWERERHAAQQTGQVRPPAAAWLRVPLSPQTSSSSWAEVPHGWTRSCRDLPGADSPPGRSRILPQNQPSPRSLLTLLPPGETGCCSPWRAPSSSLGKHQRPVWAYESPPLLGRSCQGCPSRSPRPPLSSPGLSIKS